jgi:excisionase family DNA binding protein
MEGSKKKFDVSQIGEFFTVKEAAAEGRLHPVTVRKLLTDGKLTRYKLGRKTLIKRDEFIALIKPTEIVAQG